MKTLILATFFLVFAWPLFAQKSPAKFGEIPLEDMTMSSYEFDTSASAVVLLDYGEAYIQSSTLSASMTFERHVRIKILKQEGTQWANAIIPLYQIGSSEEKVMQLKASTFNLENGKMIETKLSKEAIFQEKFNRNIIHQKFAFPDVKAGSVIEYSYKIFSDFVTNFPNWQFQREIPIRLSEYWAIIPEFFVFEKYIQGYVPLSGYEVKSMNYSGYKANGYHHIAKNVPAFKAEPYMTSDTDYISKINFALSHIQFPNYPVQEIMGSWKKLNELLLEDEDFYGVIKGSGFLKKTVEEVLDGLIQPLDKITAIHSYVKNTIEWDGYRDFYAGNLKKVVELRKGSSGDINLLLASMLVKAGFEVDLVLLSTRDHGFIRQQYPMMRQFNYVVVRLLLDDKTMLIDATEKQLPVDVIPERCLNGQGLVISKDRHGWIPIESKIKAKTTINAVMELDDSGDVNSKLELTYHGYDAHKMRKQFSSKGEDIFVKDFFASNQWEPGKIKFENVADVTLPAKGTYEFEIPDYAFVANEKIYLSPFLTGQVEMNPYKTETREYPVDYGTLIEQVYLCKIKLPEGYVLEEAPESRILTLPENAARYIYNVSYLPDAKVISITSSFQINRNIFLQQDYPNLREFYNQVVAKQAEQIVLKKKL